MVDSLLETSEGKTVSGLTVQPGNLFVENGFFKEPGLIENIAQTAALKAGYEASVNKKPAPVGFIGSVKRMKIYNLPKTGQTLTTTLTVLTQMANISVVKGEITVEGTLLAEGEMNIFLQE